MSELPAFATTESENPATADIDRLDPQELIARLQAEDAVVHEAVAAERTAIAEATRLAARAITLGGSVHHVGAGTSGRLGVLDASEIPPTFGAPDTWFQGHIAGGDRALREAIEGAEDSREEGASLVTRLDLGAEDLLIAISASGRTPFCLGALDAARGRGTPTVALVCNENSAMEAASDLTICPLVGPESITGSTRLKAGTAQKMVLNLISTGAMVLNGATYGNLMVGVTPTNEKLRDRARRLVHRILGADVDAAAALASAGDDVRTACVLLRHGIDADAARSHLATHRGSLRSALEHAPGE